MDDLVIYRRRRSTGGQFMPNTKFGMRVQTKNGRFTVFNNLSEKLGIKDGSAIMFAFSKSKNCSFVFTEEPEDDSYICKYANGGRNYFRFTSKSLALYFVEFFNIKDQENIYFEVGDALNEKGYLKITPFIKNLTKL